MMTMTMTMRLTNGMNLTRRMDMVGYLHVAYGAVLALLACFILLTVSVGAFLFPFIAAWVVGLGASGTAGLILLGIGLPSMVAGIGLIRRLNWARILIVALSVIDLFSFPVGTALGAFSLWTVLQRHSALEFR